MSSQSQETGSLSEYIKVLSKLSRDLKGHLPAEAKAFYQGTAPSMLVELRQIRALLERTLKEVQFVGKELEREHRWGDQELDGRPPVRT